MHIVSGRRRRNLEQWFGRLPVHLCAEHGYLARAPGGEWRTLVDLDLSWLRPIERLLRRVAADVPGAHVERKSCSVAWHYRQAEPEYGSWRARELLERPPPAPRRTRRPRSSQGHQVVEVRAQGVDKGVYVRSLFPDGKEPTHFVLGLGDDRTDHDLLDALPSGLRRRPRRRAASEQPERERAARGHPPRRPGRGARVPARPGRERRLARAGARGASGGARSSTSATR